MGVAVREPVIRQVKATTSRRKTSGGAPKELGMGPVRPKNLGSLSRAPLKGIYDIEPYKGWT